MSMSTGVVSLRDPKSKRHAKKVKVLEACKEAGVNMPEEVDKYFDGDFNNKDGPLEVQAHYREWADEEYSSEGIEVDVADIPEDVKTIRFYNSW